MNQFALRTVGVNLQTTIAMDLQEPLNQKPVRRIERRGIVIAAEHPERRQVFYEEVMTALGYKRNQTQL